MSTLKIIRKRITSVRSTQKITRAMKLVSAAKLRRATERAQSSRPYEEELTGIVASTLHSTRWASPLLEEREVKRVAFVVFTTDRGLCGSLNSNILKAVLKRAEDLKDKKIEIIALGKKGRLFLKRREFEIKWEESDLLKRGKAELMTSIAAKLREAFVDGTYDQIEVFYSKFRSALVQIPTQDVWLPYKPKLGAVAKDFICEPGAIEMLDKLVPMLLNFQLYRMLVEMAASEHGARMSAMDSATSNAKAMIGRLTLQRNRARQAAITKELMEIIGGAEALAG